MRTNCKATPRRVTPSRPPLPPTAMTTAGRPPGDWSLALFAFAALMALALAATELSRRRGR